MEGGLRSAAAAGFLVGLGLIVGGALVGRGLIDMRQGQRQVTVHGLSEQVQKADLALLPISFAQAGDELTATQAKVDDQTRLVRAFLKAQGYSDAQVDLDKLSVTDTQAQEYNNRVGGPRFIVTQTVIVRTGDVDRVAATTRALGDLVRQGVVLSNFKGPTFLFTRLNAVRPAMIGEATASARSGAEQFARDSGAHLDGITDASQGSFEILPRDESSENNESGSLWKKVRVVTTVTYRLR
jgi:hypothetical protein